MVRIVVKVLAATTAIRIMPPNQMPAAMVEII